MGVGILAKRVVLELGSSTNFVYSLRRTSSTPLSSALKITEIPAVGVFES